MPRREDVGTNNRILKNRKETTKKGQSNKYDEK
jgi:hypothetical protein